MKPIFNESRIREALEDAWSLDSAVQWSVENPANGQCNVTAAVIYDIFGGEVLRTKYPEFWHYYNRIDGKRVDLTDSQFSRPGVRVPAPKEYDDEVSDVATAMDGIPDREYKALKESLILRLDDQ